MTKRLFGTTKDGREVYAYEISNSKGMKAEIINFGAIVTKLFVPDAKGEVKDIVLGYDTVAEYEVNDCFFGATIAPSANRIGNARFTIDGVDYQVDVNDGQNNLHSHIDLGSHKQIWDAKEAEGGVKFSLAIKDMEMGFPGNKEISVTYTISESNELKLEYKGVSDKNTIINPTNHSYFNLSGADSETTILDNVLTLNAAHYTPVAKGAIPTGEIAPVNGTVMDFTKGLTVGDHIDDNFEQLVITSGYDHNFVIDDYDGTVKKIAEVKDPKTSRKMEVYTNLPGVQFYAGNCVGEQLGKNKARYGKRCALCLETQFFPDSVNKPEFPSCIFGPGKDYSSITIYKF